MHPVRDARIRVTRAPNCVLVDGAPVHYTATNVLREFADVFQPEATVRAMMAKPSWPGAAYAVGARTVDALDAHLPTQVLRDGVVHQVLAPGDVRDVAEAHALFGSDVELRQFDRPMTEREVLKAWDDKGRATRAEGTEAHRAIEEHLLAPRGAPRGAAGVAQAFLDEWMAPLGGRVAACEWTIFDEAASVLATIDAVVRFPDGRVALIDWKNWNKSSDASYRRLYAPLGHIPDTGIARAALQLGLYAAILQRRYGMRVCGLYVVNVSDGGFSDLPYLEDEAVFLLEHCASRLASRPDAEPRCARDGLLALQPVRCEDGRVRSARAAQAAGLRYANDAELAAQSEALMAQHFRESAKERLARGRLAKAVDFETLVPPQGVPSVALNYSNFAGRYF